MPRLNQINALVSGKKTETERVVTDLYKIIQKPDLFNGLERFYSPLDEVNGKKLPPEKQKIQHRVKDIVKQAVDSWTTLWDLVLTQDTSNQQAKSDIVVDGVVVVKNVPVTTLLFLEKQIANLESFISKLPTPDSTDTWTWDANSGSLRNQDSETLRTEKEPAHYVKYQATKEHPAQVEYFQKDVPVGKWRSVKFTASVPVDQKNKWLEKVRKLHDAVKIARENANMLEVQVQKMSESIFDFVLK
jgi:hypothetical protein